MTSRVEPTVTFALRTGRSHTPESELRDHADAWRAEVAANENLEGILTIRGGQADVVVEDDLHATIQNLCLRASLDLLAGREARMLYFSCAGEMALTPEGADVRISGDFLSAEVRLPGHALVRALIACARRFVELLVVLDDPRHVGLVGLLRGQVEATEAALSEGAAS